MRLTFIVLNHQLITSCDGDVIIGLRTLQNISKQIEYIIINPDT